MKKIIVLDLCAGSKMSTQAFTDRGHIVETLDIEGEHTYINDVRTWTLPQKHYNFIWASPPCTEFSLADPRKPNCKKRDVSKGLSVVYACLDIIKKLAPDFWVLENPRGCLRFYIGKPSKTIFYNKYGYPMYKPTDLWGNFPYPYFKSSWVVKPEKNAWDKVPKNKRSVVPYNLGLAFCIQLEQHFNDKIVLFR